MTDDVRLPLLIRLYTYAGPEKELIDECARRIAALESAMQAIAGRPDNVERVKEIVHRALWGDP